MIWNEPNLSGFWRPQFGPPGSERARAVRGSARALLRRAARASPVDQRDRAGDVCLGKRQPERVFEHLALADDLHRGHGRGVSRERPHRRRCSTRWATTRTRRARTSGRGSCTRIRRSSRSAISGAAVGAPAGVRWNGADAAPGRRADLVPGDRLPDHDPRVEERAVLRHRGLARRRSRPGVTRAACGSPPDSSPAPDQATQLTDELRDDLLPSRYVAADFNFMLEDEPCSAGGSRDCSGPTAPVRAPTTRSRPPLPQVNAGTVDCSLDQRRAARHRIPESRSAVPTTSTVPCRSA